MTFCSCKTHTLYTYEVKATKESNYFLFDKWEYTGVHSCKNCSGDFSDRHYLGSSTDKKYQEIKSKVPEILILKTIKNFNNCVELDLAEAAHVNYEYIMRADTFNKSVGGGRSSNPRLTVCTQCEGTHSSHRKSCTLYKKLEKCPECSGLRTHKKICSLYRRKACEECKVSSGHYKTCSNYKVRAPCKECFSAGAHKQLCSLAVKIQKCSICSSPINSHKKHCDFYKKSDCEDCSGLAGNHKKYCKKYTLRKFQCAECKSNSSSSHRLNCSKFRHLSICKACGSRGNNTHKKGCDLYRTKDICSECSSSASVHTKECSRWIRQKSCDECKSHGSVHLKKCSNYSGFKPCSECSLMHPLHDNNCSRKYKSITCNLCSGKHNKHYKACVLYKAKSCTFCGSATNHRKTCVKKKEDSNA